VYVFDDQKLYTNKAFKIFNSSQHQATKNNHLKHNNTWEFHICESVPWKCLEFPGPAKCVVLKGWCSLHTFVIHIEVYHNMGILWIPMKQWSNKKLTHTHNFVIFCRQVLIWAVTKALSIQFIQGLMLPGFMGIIGSHYQDSYMNQPVSWNVKRVLNLAHVRCCSMQILSYKTNLCANSAFVLCVAPCETSQHCWKRRTMVVLNSSDPTRTWRISACALSKLQFQLGDGQQPN